MREPVSRRTYLMVKAMEKGAHPLMAAEAVASTAIEHPEWNMDEVKTWDQWERDDG